MSANLSLMPSWIGTRRRAVAGVSPPSAFYERRQLLHALERVFSVQFEPRANGEWRGLHAAIVFGEVSGGADGADQPADAQLPMLIVPARQTRTDGTVQRVRLAEVDRVDPRLHGCDLACVVGAPPLPRHCADVVDIARAGVHAVWQTSVRAPRIDHVNTGPRELGPGESLRDQLREGRYLQLLPLFEFLRELTAYERPEQDIRTSFIVDDPNLHWRSYGSVSFESLARHARAHDYHVTFATVPLDCSFAWPGAVRTFRTSADVLSVTSHGAHHSYRELARHWPAEAAARLLDDAAARLDRFTHRSGVPVSRVMVPPHSASVLAVHEPLLRAGFEALCTSLGWWSDWGEAESSIAGIAPADVSPAGLPVFARHALRHPFLQEDAIISAYLDQPVVLYGHVEDVADGYGLLASLAEWLCTLGPTRRLSLEDVARTNLLTQFDPATATSHLHLLARHGFAVIPPGARLLSVEGPGSADHVRSLSCAGAMLPVRATASGWRSEELPCEGGRAVEVVLGGARNERVRPRPRPAPLRAYLRRGAVEARDRLGPTARRLGLEAAVVAVEAGFRAARRSRDPARQPPTTSRR